MRNINAELIKIGRVSGMFYHGKSRVRTLLVYGLGAPVVPDNGLLPEADVVMKYQADLFVPDYIGYGRSDGKFTPMGCINTFLNLYEGFAKGCVGKNYYSRKNFGTRPKFFLQEGRCDILCIHVLCKYVVLVYSNDVLNVLTKSVIVNMVFYVRNRSLNVFQVSYSSDRVQRTCTNSFTPVTYSVIGP